MQLALGDHEGNAVLNVAGALLLTLPLAVRRRHPLAVVGIYIATAALTSILGGGLFAGDPPPFACLLAGALTFYSLGAHAEDRPGQAGAARRRRGAVDQRHRQRRTPTCRASCSPAA